MEYATGQLGLPQTLLLNAIFIAAFVEVITIPLFGWLSDYFGRRIFYVLGTFFTASSASRFSGSLPPRTRKPSSTALMLHQRRRAEKFVNGIWPALIEAGYGAKPSRTSS